MPDVSFNEACKKYKEIKTDPKIYRNEQIPGYYYLRELEIEKPSITISYKWEAKGSK